MAGHDYGLPGYHGVVRAVQELARDTGWAVHTAGMPANSMTWWMYKPRTPRPR